MFERFTKDVRQAVLEAAEEASRARGDSRLGSEHLLYGLAAAGDSVAVEMGITAERVHDELIAWDVEALGAIGLETEPDVVSPARPGSGWGRWLFRHHLPFTVGAKNALKRSLQICLAQGHRSIDTTHLLAGLAVGGPRDPAVRLLYRLGLDPATVDRAARAHWS